MKYIIQVRKDVEESRAIIGGVTEVSKPVETEKDWVNRLGSFNTLDEAVEEGRSIIERDVHLARNVRVITVAAEFESRTIIEEVLPS